MRATDKDRPPLPGGRMRLRSWHRWLIAIVFAATGLLGSSLVLADESEPRETGGQIADAQDEGHVMARDLPTSEFQAENESDSSDTHLPGSSADDSPASASPVPEDDSLPVDGGLLDALFAETCPMTVTIAGEGPLDFGSSTWTGTAYPPVTAGPTILVAADGDGCDGIEGGWNIDLSASAMVNEDASAEIPPEFLAFAGSEFSGVPDAGIVPAAWPAETALGEGLTIATTEDAEASEASWEIGLTLSPPTDAPPGTYHGTITVTAGNSGG